MTHGRNECGMTLIQPHGGQLIHRLISEQQQAKFYREAQTLPKIFISKRTLSDLEGIGIGAFSPLRGFMNKQDYMQVIKNMRLADGTIWSLPITLAVSPFVAERLKVGKQAALIGNQDHEWYGIITIDSIYEVNLFAEAKQVLGTTDTAHPGVQKLLAGQSIYVGGSVYVNNLQPSKSFAHYPYTPTETRNKFEENGWCTVVGFQTRNPIHRAHEYIQKSALEIVDGLLIHALIGETTADDLSAEVRMRSYEVLVRDYYPTKRVLLSVFPAAMRYAGPREAIFYAIVRKNYGCTHFIIGRDHAGVGNYYDTYEEQHIFQQFKVEELGIQPLCFENSFFCQVCDSMVSHKTCPHPHTAHVTLSGTKVRQLLYERIRQPSQLLRPEVAQVLITGIAEEKASKNLPISLRIFVHLTSYRCSSLYEREVDFCGGKEETETNVHPMDTVTASKTVANQHRDVWHYSGDYDD